MSALTDSNNEISYDPENRPGISNLIDLLHHFRPCPVLFRPEELATELQASGVGFRALKEDLAAKISEGLQGVRDRYAQVMSEDDGKYLDYVAAQGAEKARASAEETMALIAPAVGTAWRNYDGSC